MDRGHGQECKNESESTADSNRLEDEVYTERVGPKASRASVFLKTGMVKDVVGIEEGSMVSTNIVKLLVMLQRRSQGSLDYCVPTGLYLK